MSGDELFTGEIGRFAGVVVHSAMPEGTALIGSFPSIPLRDEPPACPECGGLWQPLGLGHAATCGIGWFIKGEILAMQVRSPASMVVVTGIV